MHSYDSSEHCSFALNQRSRDKEAILKLLWDVCKSYGAVGECVFIIFKYRIGEVL